MSSPAPSPSPSPSPSPFPFPPPERTDGAWRISGCGWGDSTPAPTPDLVLAVVGHGGDAWLQRARPHADRVETVAQSDAFLAAPAAYGARHGLAVDGEDVYAYGGTRAEGGPALLRLDGDLRVLTRAAIPEYAAMAARDGVVFVAGDWLRAYDRGLALLGEIELPLKDSWSGKTAHDMILHDGIAYLLDDVVLPLWVIRVDVRDPAAMRVIDRVELSGGHLAAQWIDAADGRWMVLGSWGGMGGGYEEIVALPLGEGGSQGGFTSSSSRHDPLDGSNATREGFSLRAVLPDGSWALAADEDGAHLGRFDVDAAAKTVDLCEVPFELTTDGPRDARLVGGDGFVAGTFGGTLFVVGAGGDGPVLAHASTLDGVVALALAPR